MLSILLLNYVVPNNNKATALNMKMYAGFLILIFFFLNVNVKCYIDT